MRELHAEKERRPLLSLAAARANRERLAYDDLPAPAFTGTRVVEPSLEQLVPLIDWQFFFHAWELRGKFPAILEQPAARELYDDAQALLAEIVRDGWLVARGVHGFWPAHADGDDVVLEGEARFPMLRQQADWGDSRPNRCLADYVAPEGDDIVVEGETRFPMLRQQADWGDSRPNRCLADLVAPGGDHIGAFAVAIHGADELAARFEAEQDDYRAIMAKALADRLAEAFAEWLHLAARRGWYEPDASPTSEDLIAERYRGIRPAFGYPACPDHSEKRRLFELLDAERVDLELTESCAMQPAAAVSGLLLGHPSARYFAVGRVARDQVEDYAARKGVAVTEVERWLRPNLAYDPK